MSDFDRGESGRVETPPSGAIGDPGPRAAPSAVPWANVARGLKLAALLLFLLPWVTVSCADQTLVSMSGYEMATGSATVHNPLTGETGQPPDASRPNLAVLAAAILIAAALLLSLFLRRRTGAFASIAALGVAAVLIVWTVLIELPAKAHEGATAQAGASFQGLDQAELLRMIRVEASAGFWLTLAALVAAIAAAWMAQRRPPG